MHTFRNSSAGYEVIFVNEHGSDVVYKATSEVDAMSVVSYLNGGAYPPLWNPPLSQSE